MASQSTLTRKRDKVKAFFQRKTPQPLESDNNIAATSPLATPLPQSSIRIVPAVPNPLCIPPSPRRAFVKSKFFEKDIAILSTTYILEENPELKRLIHLIVEMHEKDEEDQFIDVLETCAKFSVQLGSAIQTHRTDSTHAITVFLKTIETINTVQPGGDTQSLHALQSMVDDEIAKIRSSHPIFVPGRDIGTSEGLSKLLSVTLGTSITFLDVVKGVSSVIPIPWVAPVIGGVMSLLNAIVQTRSNYDDMRQIATTAGDFVLSCAVIFSDRTMEPSKELKRALNKFTKTLECIAQECDELSRLNPFWRYLQKNVHSSNLQAIRTRLNTAIELFQTESQINMQLDVNEIRRNFDYAALSSLPNHPNYVPDEYLEGSQNDVLGYISDWIGKPNELVLWIHGAAGLGKSTVGQQLVHLLQSDDRLAGGVFLTNITTEHPKTVIQMISRQLGQMHPGAIANIAEAARKLDGPHGSLKDCFMAYIIDPVRALKFPYQLVIVIDGLDEWTNYESFLVELAHIPSPPPLKFVVISRPNHSIERVLNKIPVQQYPLLPVSQETIENYFNHHFEMIDWRGRKPDKDTINRLAAHAHGLLIWAATVRSLLSHESDDRYPHVILDQILWSEEKVGSRSGESLGRLYRDAVTTLFPEPDMREKLEDFLGAMMVIQEALSIRDFAHLLGMPERPTEEIQRRLAALQTRGSFNRDIVPPAIQRFHVSFLEFIESTPTHYDERPISINMINAHSMIANGCLEIVFSELFQSHRGQTCPYSQLCPVESYAVKFWPLHFSNGTPRLLPALPATRLSRGVIDISEEAMRRWATLFLPCIAVRFQDGYKSLDDISRSMLPYELAMIIGVEDITTLLYQIHCLEIAARLQPIDVETWTALGKAYRLLYKHGKYNKNLDEAITVFRQALELVSQKQAGKGILDHVDANVARDIGRSTNACRTDIQGHILWHLADALEARFEWRGASNDLDEVISLRREALVLQPEPHPDHMGLLNNLANALLVRFNQRGASNDLDEGISLYQEVLQVVVQPGNHPLHSLSLCNLANTFLIRFQQRGASNDVEEAISLHREALDLRPVPHPHRSMSLNNLAHALLTRFEQRGTSNDLNEVISLHREALFLRPAPHPLRSTSLNNLANSLQTRFEQQGTSNDLDEAISLHREVLVLWPACHPRRSLSLNNLGTALLTHFNRRGGSNVLDEAISLLREALILRPTSHSDRSMSLNNLALGLLTCFEQRSASNDLDEAISLLQEALVLRSAPHLDRSKSLNSLADALITHFEQWGTCNDLDQAISLYREALLLQPASHPRHSKTLSKLANALLTCFKQRGASNDLDESVSLLREALVLQPAPHPLRAASLNDLANSLLTYFEQRGTSTDLDEAISLLREVLVLQPAPHRFHAVSLQNLINALQTRFDHQRTSNDLDEVISLLREALVQPEPTPDRSMPFSHLSSFLLLRFNTQGLSNDLEEGISLLRKALVLRPAPHPFRSMSLNNLGRSLLTRFEQHGASNDLHEAICSLREALVLSPASDPNRSMSLDNLAKALLTRFDQRGASNDLDEAISLLREALVLVAGPPPDRSLSLSNLASSLLARFNRQGASNDLDEGISLHREALVLLPAPHPDRPLRLYNLANCLITRFEQRSALNDLDEAIPLYGETLASLSTSHPLHSMSVNKLIDALKVRSDHQGASNDHERVSLQ